MKPLPSVFGAVICISLVIFPGFAARAEDEVLNSAPPLPAFFKDASFEATLYYFQRYRDRMNVGKDRYAVNLSHATTQLALDFESGYISEFLGFDFGIFGASDFYNKGDPGHEMNFFPSRDPWTSYGNKKRAKDGVSVYKALAKVKAGPVWARAGYFQPQGPGILGVNWSFLPGTYQGAEVGADLGKLSLAAAWANQYKAPWYNEVYKFKKNDGLTEVDYVWSMGARYQATDGLSLEAAYGESQDFLWNAHFKAKYNRPVGDGRLSLGWHSYLMNDKGRQEPGNDNFSSTATQQFLAAGYETGPWNFNLEFLYTHVPHKNPGNVGYFAYRPVSGYGSSKGAYEPWWDLRSDWNHHEEKAAFLKIGRSLDDIGLDGWKAAVSGAYGWGARADGTTKKLEEVALGLDLSYTVGSGFLEGAVFALHYTRYDNRTNIPSWTHFKNAFQDEHDVKFSLVIPLVK